MKTLQLIFENEDGKNATYTLNDPVEPADPEDVKAAMETVIEQDVFNTNGGRLVKIKAAKIIDREVEEIELD
ncbi:MAG TPA: DUF2922 domain-containing protein [Pseudogracilibacillus sp.]|nr:DUF2922 domain-containing protein [Pseudogracilibacillus sp.]